MGAVMRIHTGPFLVFSDFDSGNVLTAENVQINRTTPLDSSNHDYELNVCTKPDCFETVFENGNRTWFHFGIQGGKTGAILKLNILNLNKQVKLFTQGMQPVFRYLPGKPVWERIHDKLLINEKEEHICSISFRQRLPEDTDSILYVAFTYPYSTVELTEWLNTLDSIYLQTKLEGLPFHVNCKLSPIPSRAELLMVKSVRSTKNQIYYHRECVCYSLEGRRIELITITSCEGMSEDREERLNGLFPLLSEARPNKFPSKKVIFLSARVHPGETPSSFVLNGLHKFLLVPTDPRALLLRKLFVFKLIPMLNPDGVALGHYRSDSRGVNLNRVYLQPSQELHPSIFATRKLLLYYHCGIDDIGDFGNESVCKQDCDIPSSRNFLKTEPARRSRELRRGSNSKHSAHSSQEHGNRISLRSTSSTIVADKKSRCRSTKSNEEKLSANDIFCAKEDNTETTFEACDEDSLVYVSPAKIQASARGYHQSNAGSKSVSPSKRKESISTKHRESSRDNLSQISGPSNSSGLFCYIDMHGHATKRGIFMYGNHFEDPNIQAECMLLPKLMSLNCPNFDFSACNFTERLMNMRDRRSGASREGSGRVAIFKLTGLIQSYTLECNYNTGRLVNNILNRESLLGLSDDMKFCPHPPKFTPEIFEEAGRALAESLLDLTNRNPFSRVTFTEYKNIDGMKKSLLKRIQVSRELESSEGILKGAESGPLLCKRQTRNSIIQPAKPCSSKSFKKSLPLDKSTTCKSVTQMKRTREKIKHVASSETRSSLHKSFKIKRKSSMKVKKN